MDKRFFNEWAPRTELTYLHVRHFLGRACGGCSQPWQPPLPGRKPNPLVVFGFHEAGKFWALYYKCPTCLRKETVPAILRVHNFEALIPYPERGIPAWILKKGG